MLIEDIELKIKEKIEKQIINSRVLLDKLRLIDEQSRKSSQYQDPRYLPFYYYLSKFVQPKSIFHVGFDLGLPLCCFFQGNNTAERVLCFQREDEGFYSPNLAISNIKDIKGKKFNIDYYYGKIVDYNLQEKMNQKFDLIMITEKINDDQINETLDICWEYLNLEGYLVVDYIFSNENIGKIVKSFSNIKNRPCALFKTRYGTSLIQK